jgi:hypothetical protein
VIAWRRLEKEEKADGTSAFHAQVRTSGFPARTETFPTRRLAERWANTVEAEMIEGRHFRSSESRRRALAMEGASEQQLHSIGEWKSGIVSRYHTGNTRGNGFPMDQLRLSIETVCPAARHRCLDRAASSRVVSRRRLTLELPADAPDYAIDLSYVNDAPSIRMIFIESPIFTADARELLSDEEYAALQAHLVSNPDAGDVIQGTGGLRKVRWTTRGARQAWRHASDLLPRRCSRADSHDSDLPQGH